MGEHPGQLPGAMIYWPGRTRSRLGNVPQTSVMNRPMAPGDKMVRANGGYPLLEGRTVVVDARD